MKLSKEIVSWIREQVQKASKKGVVLGLSGGIDSSCVAVLSKKALGHNVLGMILPCRSSPIDEEFALKVARKFDIETKKVVLDDIYDNLLHRNSKNPPTCPPKLEERRRKHIYYEVSSLAKADTLIKLYPEGSDIAKANLKPRLRMVVLYYFANTLDYLVAGTGNKSELSVGYFTKYGDGGVDILPLGGLLKTEVRKLAEELEIPKEIIDRPPSAGLWQGQTDEGELGMGYNELDRIIDALEKRQTKGIEKEKLIKVKTMVRNSQHKRDKAPIFKRGKS